ncbi:MAG: hypothetical protein RH942_02970 [Kiloniellaceae bacterium]
MDELQTLFTDAQQSRRGALNAAGLLNSSMMENSKRQWEEDKTAIAEIADQLPSKNASFEHLKVKELEDMLVTLGQIKGRIESLIKRYEGEMQKDNVRREHVSANRRNSGPPRTSSFE